MHCTELESEPAIVFWFLSAPPLVGRTGELRSQFPTLRQALSFVLLDLPPDLQKSAWVLVRGGWFGPDQIQRLGTGVAVAAAPEPVAIEGGDAEMLARAAVTLRAGAELPWGAADALSPTR